MSYYELQWSWVDGFVRSYKRNQIYQWVVDINENWGQTLIVCCVDNVGPIFMAENVTATLKSKHIDTRVKFVTQFVDDGFLKILFVKTAENVSDMFTKNVSSNTYKIH